MAGSTSPPRPPPASSPAPGRRSSSCRSPKLRRARRCGSGSRPNGGSSRSAPAIARSSTNAGRSKGRRRNPSPSRNARPTGSSSASGDGDLNESSPARGRCRRGRRRGRTAMRLEGSEGGRRNARRLRREMTPPEIGLWLALRDNAENLRFRKQHAAGSYVLDFYCAPAKLAIEVDGEAHERGDRPERDAARDAWLAS
eukprot:Opistho-1_new@6312